jgi:hypothetical protein
MLALCACASDRDRGDGAPALSRFATDSLISGSVLENVTACRVDAVCRLRIQFADTAVDAVYGHGERDRPPCVISRPVSDAAFRVERGALVDVVVSRCGSEGHSLQRLVPH